MKIIQPALAPQLEVGTSTAFAPEASLERVRFADIDIVDRQARNMSFEEVLLEKVIAVQANLEKSQCSDVIAQGCDWSGANWAEASVIRSAFGHCRGSGWDLNKSLLKQVTFRDCKLDMANFRFASLQQVQFIDCTFMETDFQGARLEQVEFQHCTFDKTEFGQCTIKKVDLRSSHLLEIRGWQSLKGALVDDAQLVAIAPQLAATLGLKVG